jgi:hypothetical protein
MSFPSGQQRGAESDLPQERISYRIDETNEILRVEGDDW